MIRCVHLWTGDDGNSHFAEAMLQAYCPEKCLADPLTNAAWLPKLKEIIPAHGVSLIENAALLRRVRAETAAVLEIENL